jgi:hypothetical protein
MSGIINVSHKRVTKWKVRSQRKKPETRDQRPEVAILIDE